jgi:hypothetical protein
VHAVMLRFVPLCGNVKKKKKASRMRLKVFYGLVKKQPKTYSVARYSSIRYHLIKNLLIGVRKFVEIWFFLIIDSSHP